MRIGLHTGTPFAGAEGYVGEDVHLGARIAASAHGGQVVLSRATRELAGRELRELGEHRLKDIVEPVFIYQLGDERFPRSMRSQTRISRARRAPSSAVCGK